MAQRAKLGIPATAPAGSLTNRSASQSSLRGIEPASVSDLLEVFPPEVVIKDIETDQTYEVTLCVRNLSNSVRRIRFMPPKTSRFVAQYDTVKALAIGMRLNVTISFETEQLGDFHDEISIKMEGIKDTIRVPLHAFQKRPEVNFDSFVNLGFTTVNKPVAGKVFFRNEGSLKGNVKIIYDKALTPELSVVPETFALDPEETKDVALSYMSREINTFRCVLEVEIEGQDLIRHIDVNANCVEQQIVLVAPSIERLRPSDPELGPSHLAVTSSINFGTMYHGQSKDVSSYLVNVGPFPAKFVIKFVQGSEDEVESDNYLLMTPQELATQSIKRAFDANPIVGIIPPFSQFPIKFTCASKKMEGPRGWAHNMMKEKTTSEEISSSQVLDHEASYYYTALFSFAEIETKLTVQLQARAIFPNVEISHLSIHFYECPINEHRDFLIKMENKNDELPLDFEFSHIAHFTMEPHKGLLLPLQAKSITVTFKPGNFGTFDNTAILAFLGAAYKIPIKLYGQSSKLGVKPKTCRGPESKVRDFDPPRTFVSEEEIARGTLVSPKQWLTETFPTQIESTALDKDTDRLLSQQAIRAHYNDYLKESREKRLRTAHLLKRTGTAATTLTLKDYETNVDLTLHTAPPRSRHLQLPVSQDGLVVDKPIGKYDTINQKVQAAFHDPEKPVKNTYKRLSSHNVWEETPFFETPIRQQDIKECSAPLSPYDMRLISAGPRELKFDRIVIRSEVAKWFSVVNDLKQNILVELSSSAEEVNRIEPESLVIPPGFKGGFKITIMSAKKHRIERTVKYVINGRYEFHFMVEAEVEPAVLDISLPDQVLSPNQAPFLFFKFDEENLDESLSKQINVLNRSPAAGRFAWQLPSNSNFEVDPKEDVIEALRTKTVIVRFVPGLTSWKNEEETLVMKVDNGESQGLIVRGEVTEARCSFMQKTLDYGVIAVGIKVEKPISIKNSDPKNAIFHVKRFPSQMTVSPMRGKIPPEGKFPLKVVMCTMFEEELNGELEVMVRGGKTPLKLQVHASSIIPRVFIQEPDIDFGQVTVSSTLVRRFTLINESPIAAILYLNLEEHPEFEVNLPTEDADIESTILVPATMDKESPFYLKEDEDDADDPKPDPMMNEEESEEEEVEEVHRKFKITVAGGRTVALLLRFSPKDTELYQFNLPIVLAGVNQTVSGLQKTVSGEGIKPRFIVEPALLKFKNKVISSDKNFASVTQALLSNPEAAATHWRLDTSPLDADMVFAMKPSEGSLESGTYANVRVSFNPTQATAYEAHVNLYLDSIPDPYMTLTLQGEGTVPRIVFDRREVILPIVPLGITAKATFYVINDGYENVELTSSVPQDAGNIQLNVSFPDGKQLGVTKQKIAAEVTFVSERPVSFTIPIEFIDLDGKKYTIAVSGTSDNSLLTVFPFIQRNPDEIRFETNENGPVKIIQEVESDADMYSERGKSGGHRTTGGSSVVSHSAKSIIGFNPIPQPLLEQSLEFLTRWLNHSVLSTPINKLPDDIIETHGAQVYELVYSLTGKYPPGQVTNFAVPARELTKLLMDQYSELIAFLKLNGAMLNTIRPEYLLSMGEYSRYLKSTPNQLQLRQRQIERRWPYLSMDAWVTLLYQVIKVFILNRINPKTFKSLPGMPAEKASIEPYMRESNVYSLSECILLKWMGHHYSTIFAAQHRRLINFDQDLIDGTVIGAVVQSHVGLIGSLLKLKASPVSEEHKKNNVEKMLAALSEIGMPSFVTQKDLTLSAVSPREMVLFCMSLYQLLPHYIPKCTIEFSGSLGETVTKSLELSNPSSKQVTYWVKLDGSTDFVLTSGSEFSIAARSTAMFPVKFQSRLSSEVRATLRFTSRASEGSAHAAAMVFLLVSKVTSRKSEKVYDVSAHLYELGQKDLEISNPFPKDGEFMIQIVYPEKEIPIVSQPRGKKLTQTKETIVEPPIVFPKAFFIKNERVKIKRNSSNMVSLTFMPFDTERSEAFLIFTDDNVGEMQYTVVGTALPPKVDKQDRMEVKGEMGEMLIIPVPISAKNHQYVRAKQEALQRLNGASKAKERDILKEIFRNLEAEETGAFEVVLSSPFFSCPPTVVVQDAVKSKKPGVAGTLDTSQISYADTASRAENTLTSDQKTKKGGKFQTAVNAARLTGASGGIDKGNQLLLNLAPRQPGEYACQITLTNARKTDIRTLEVVAQIKPKKSRMTLEMTAQARESVSQEIPIVNNADKEWKVNVKLSQDAGLDLFTATKDLIVKKRTTGNVLITFRPEWVCEARARLDIEIPATAETYEFELIGHGEEPRAEEHYVIQCRVKERSKHYITVPNPRTYPLTYRVVSDIMSATGEAMLEVPAGSTADYELVMYPLQSGTYTGSITFYDPQNRFYWFTLEVQAATPEPEAARELRVQCRKAVEFKITVYNPLPEETRFDVNVVGSGLFGEPHFSLGARETGTYQLIYTPLLVGESEGSVAFLSEKTGEFWYHLHLICDPAEPIEKEIFECELGKSIAKAVTLENPSNREVILDYFCSNTLNYELIPDKIILPAYGSVDALIKYSPTSLKLLETADIVLSSKEIGDWIFKLTGKGLPPTEMEPLVVTASISESNSIQVTFRNPFREPISVSISLDSSSDVLQLLLRRAKFSVGPQSILLIPVGFRPQNMEEVTGVLIVAMNEELTWRFPLRGITERPSNKLDFIFRTKCRVAMEKDIDIHLHDLGSLPEEENFSHDLQVSNPELATLVTKSFKLEPLRNILTDPSEALQFKVKFEPLRPFRTEAELFIYKGSGGRWRYNVLIEAKDPDLDDTIVIEAPMHKNTSVAFRLCNHFKQYASFEAFFAEGSDPFFIIQPEKGILEPYGREGTQFVVSFTPVEYGAPKAATLVIRTDDMQWSYLIKGTHPTYHRPEMVGGRLDNRLFREAVQTARPRKNFIKDNIVGSRRSPKRLTSAGHTTIARPSTTR